MRALILALTLGATIACAHQITGYTQQPKTLARADRDSVLVIVRWVRGVDDLVDHCDPVPGVIVYACAIPRGPVCTVWAVQPDDFDDATKLAILGHELWHCLGAQHARS
jgi:hypothetical protein